MTHHSQHNYHPRKRIRIGRRGPVWRSTWRDEGGIREEQGPRRLSTAVILVGIGFLFLTKWWWPGIMFVLAASLFVRAIFDDDPGARARHLAGALVVAAIPFVFRLFAFGLRFWITVWPLLLIVGGAFLVWKAMQPSRDLLSYDHDLTGMSEIGERRMTDASDRAAPLQDASVFDQLSTIYDPERDMPGPPPEAPPPSMTGEEHVDVDLGALFNEGERRIDRLRRGER